MLKDLVPGADDQGPEHMLGGPEGVCGGCGRHIRDRFYLLAVDRAWHVNCLRCCRCSQTLDSELSCYAREGNIYCKEDYYRIFASKRCARCHAGLACSELVMRARDLVYHVGCFVCCVCGAPLSKGDMAGLRGGLVYCSTHYDSMISDSVVATQFFGGSTQKGRPRKRKPQTGPPEPPDLNVSSLRMDLLHPELGSPLDLGAYESSQSPGSVGGMGGNSRTKRMRTSFKHHQLRTMKSYFAINQNPDAKDLKQLAQKTGLSKRVLQVWFQNARAKWRRNIMRQEGGGTSVSAPGTPGGGTPQGPPSATLMGDSNSLPASHQSMDDIHHGHMSFSDLY